jgi:hypothetical protein
MMHSRSNRQAGQAMTEFLVALMAMLPIFLAVAYLGKYGDIQSSANQASRYASFQRAMQPDEGKLSKATVQDEVRARFFVPPKAMHGDGRIEHGETVGMIDKKKAQMALWSDMQGKNMLSTFDKVRVTWDDNALPDPGGAMSTMGKLVNHEYRASTTAMVEVDLVDRLDVSGKKKKTTPLTIAAATAAAGDGWTSGGSNDTVDSVRPGVLANYVPTEVNTVLDVVMWLFEPTGPDLGCIKPDVTPTFRLKGSAGGQGCKF